MRRTQCRPHFTDYFDGAMEVAAFHTSLSQADSLTQTWCLFPKAGGSNAWNAFPAELRSERPLLNVFFQPVDNLPQLFQTEGFADHFVDVELLIHSDVFGGEMPR